jgi:hypothetical protein
MDTEETSSTAPGNEPDDAELARLTGEQPDVAEEAAPSSSDPPNATAGQHEGDARTGGRSHSRTERDVDTGLTAPDDQLPPGTSPPPVRPAGGITDPDGPER